MEIEDTDSIEKEFDIVYSGHFSNDTKIFQFPLIPKDSLNIENIHSLSISENLKNMKMEMKVDDKYLDKNNYNAIPFQNLKGEKIENNSNLCLGIIKNNKLILTPISQIFQFRHDFSDINKEKSISLKIKKEKKDTKNIGIKKEEKEEIKYNNLSLYFPQSIDSKIVLVYSMKKTLIIIYEALIKMKMISILISIFLTTIQTKISQAIITIIIISIMALITTIIIIIP